MAEVQLRLECVRCRSTDTKFCYFNNHSRSQPRYFCKTCRRYWTHGGSTRDVPIGGGVRRLNRGGGGAVLAAAQGQGNSTVGHVNQNAAAADQGQSNPVGVNYQIQNLNLNGPHYYAVLMDPNDTLGNVYWDPFLVPNDIGSSSGPSSTGPAP